MGHKLAVTCFVSDPRVAIMGESTLEELLRVLDVNTYTAFAAKYSCQVDCRCDNFPNTAQRACEE